jgi:hemin uptake protein HemP
MKSTKERAQVACVVTYLQQQAKAGVRMSVDDHKSLDRHIGADNHRGGDDGRRADRAQAGPRRLSVAELLAGSREAILEHSGQDYRLRITANGKLILTK